MSSRENPVYIDVQTAHIETIQIPERLEVEGVIPAGSVDVVVAKAQGPRGREWAQVGIVDVFIDDKSFKSLIPRQDVVFKAFRRGQKGYAIDQSVLSEGRRKIIGGMKGIWVRKEKVSEVFLRIS